MRTKVKVNFSEWHAWHDRKAAIRSFVRRAGIDAAPSIRWGGVYLLAVGAERPAPCYLDPHLQSDVLYIGKTVSLLYRLRSSHHALEKYRSLAQLDEQQLWVKFCVVPVNGFDPVREQAIRRLEHRLLGDFKRAWERLPLYNDRL